VPPRQSRHSSELLATVCSQCAEARQTPEACSRDPTPLPVSCTWPPPQSPASRNQLPADRLQAQAWHGASSPTRFKLSWDTKHGIHVHPAAHLRRKPGLKLRTVGVHILSLLSSLCGRCRAQQTPQRLCLWSLSSTWKWSTLDTARTGITSRLQSSPCGATHARGCCFVSNCLHLTWPVSDPQTSPQMTSHHTTNPDVP
jgi:hypothetical protein